jgi:hypothetical protein
VPAYLVTNAVPGAPGDQVIATLRLVLADNAEAAASAVAPAELGHPLYVLDWAAAMPAISKYDTAVPAPVVTLANPPAPPAP